MDEGRDFEGWNCWGLFYQAFKVCRGVELFPGENFSYRQSAEALAALRSGAQAWSGIPWGQERTFDGLLFRPCHVGLVTRPGWMLNAREGRGTRVERYDNLLWQSQLIGIYRYEPAGVKTT